MLCYLWGICVLKKRRGFQRSSNCFFFFWLVVSFVIIYVEKERFSRPFELHSCVILVSNTYEEEIRDFQDFQITLILCYEFCGYMCNKGPRLSRLSNYILVLWMSFQCGKNFKKTLKTFKLHSCSMRFVLLSINTQKYFILLRWKWVQE